MGVKRYFQKERLGYIEGSISILINILLFFLKYWAGIVSSSVALIADAWHTLSDSLSSIILLAGIKLSKKKPDSSHIFGHGRWEQISAMFIGFLLGMIGFEFLRESVSKFTSKEAAGFGNIALIVTIISVIIKEALAQFAFFIFRRTDNLSVKADGWHHRTDAFSSILVLAGILVKDKFWWIDSLLGVVISILIFAAAFQVIRDSINSLLGEIPRDDLVKEINKIVSNTADLDLKPHHFHIHSYGQHRELTFHLNFPKNMSIEDAHILATRIEKEIKNKFHIESTIHIEPEILVRNNKVL